MKQRFISCNRSCNEDETVSLKCLANNVLSRNSPCNTPETGHETPTSCAFTECGAPLVSCYLPPAWLNGYNLLCTMSPPSAYPQDRWKQLLSDAGAFVEKWGSPAAALGWQPTDAFGVSPDAPDVRLDGMGLVPLLQGRNVCALTQDTARIDCGGGTTSTFTRKTMAADAILLWNLKNGSL